MAASILGMDPINFLLAVVSLLGLVFSILAFVYHVVDPSTAQWLRAAESMDRAWSTLELVTPDLTFCQGMRMHLHLNRLENQIRLTMLDAITPVSSINTKILHISRGWIKTWRLFWWSMEIQRVDVILKMIYEQRERIARATVPAKYNESSPDLAQLKIGAEETIERLVSSLGGPESTSHWHAKDIEPEFCCKININPPPLDKTRYFSSPPYTRYSTTPRFLDVESNTSWSRSQGYLSEDNLHQRVKKVTVWTSEHIF